MMAVNHVRTGKGALEGNPGEATLSLDMSYRRSPLEAPPVKHDRQDS
jgi:hypothetical protein